jgi:hypothetical protein
MMIAKFLEKGLIAIGMVMLFAVTGCSDQSTADQSPETDLPENLSLVQGSWACSCTNSGAGSCNVIIEGHTIRLRYQEEEDSSVVRESSTIERIDENLQVFILAGESGAWPYLYGTSDGREYLELEFFNRHQQEWKRLRLYRADHTKGD